MRSSRHTPIRQGLGWLIGQLVRQSRSARFKLGVLNRTMNIDTSELAAVVDTNVILDVFSCHDLIETYDKLGDKSATDPKAIYRRARARESLLLVIYLHRIQAITHSLHSEPLRQLLEHVNPDAHDIPTYFTIMFLHLIREEILHDWFLGINSTPDGELTGTAADHQLIAYAKENGLPLITNEGFTDAGVRLKKMRKWATDAGVRVYTPSEYYAGKINEKSEIEWFVNEFRRVAPRYIREHSNPAVMANLLSLIDGYMRHILVGETEGLDSLVPVAVPERKVS